jgi:hypothetical protein
MLGFGPKSAQTAVPEAEVVAEFAAVFVCERRLADFSAAPPVVPIHIKLVNFQEKGRCV